MAKLFHLADAARWNQALKQGLYEPPSLAQEGFIHLSWAQQWRLTQQRHFPEQDNLLLLEIDPQQLGSPVKLEQGFPHLYGPLPLPAVVATRPLKASRDLTVGLLSQLGPSLPDLEQARDVGCQLVVLPELPFHRWCPAQKEASPEDEDLGRAQQQAQLARASGLWLLGGSLIERKNTAFLWDPQGQEQLRYQKIHLPQEPGFWETHHFEPGQQPPQVCDELGFPLGIQLCSDIQRPFGSDFLRYQGVGAILVPRATEATTFAGWRLVMQAVARTTAAYVLSVNRPSPELGVNLGGPSLVVGPDGTVIEESLEPLTMVSLRHQAIVEARQNYPGYLDYHPQLYAQAWANLS